METKAMALDKATRGEGPLGRSADDEPVFVLVARDRYASDAIRDWADRLEARSRRLGLDRREKIAQARADADAMDKWRENNGGGKVPD